MKNLSNQKKLWSVILLTTVLSACSNAEETATLTATAPAQETAAAAATAASVNTNLPEKATYSKDDLTVDWTSQNTTKIQLNGTGATVEGAGAEAKDDTITITAAGTYVISGKLNDGQILINTPKDADVHVILNGVEIHNNDSAAIYVQEADKTVITLADGTQNIVSDGTTYAYADTSTDEPSAVIYSKSDLTVNGKGSLLVNGSYKDGLVSKDDLKIAGGSIEIHAVDDAIVGKDLVAVRDGSITVEAGGDGIKSTNDTEADKGNIAIEGGTFTIKSGSDSLAAAASIRVDGGTFSLVSGGGSANGIVRAQETFGGKGQPQAAATTQTTEAETLSKKAVKAASHIVINEGKFTIDSADDAVHSNGSFAMNGGELKVASGDDGLHADATLTIQNGKVDITKSYEGIESALITFLGGDISVVASDDGVNVGGGNDGSSVNGRPGENEFAANSNNMLSIQGGNIFVNAEGDGLDSNGNAEMSGGTVIVNGPVASMNGALDYNGTFNISGGTLAAAGSASMPMATSDTSTQASILMTYPQSQAAGTTVELKDKSGNVIATVTPAKTFGTLVISSPGLKTGATYTLNTGIGQTVEFEVTKSVTWLNESGITEASSGHGGFGGGMRMGGGRPPQDGTAPNGAAPTQTTP